LPERLVENNGTTIANTAGKDINPNVDSADYAYVISPLGANGNAAPLSLSCVQADPPFDGTATTDNYYALDATTYQIKTSSTPVFLSCSSINLTRTRGLSHSIFTNIAWQFERDNWQPYFGLGSSLEFAQNSCDNRCGGSMSCAGCCGERCTPGSNSCCNSCIDCAVSQWAVWFKGGIAYN